MQRRVFNSATIRVANTTDMSGTATADEINRGLGTGKGSKLWRIACSTFLGPLMMAGLFVAVEPLPVRADHDEDSRPGHEDNDKGIRSEIAALQAQVASMQSTVSGLQGQVNTLVNPGSFSKRYIASRSFTRTDSLPRRGLEPLRISPPDPKSGASADFATSAP